MISFYKYINDIEMLLKIKKYEQKFDLYDIVTISNY